MKQTIDPFQDRIIYAQAMNCAVELVSNMFADATEDLLREYTLRWREWFYQELCKTPPRTLAQEVRVEPPQGEPDEFQVVKMEFAGPKKNNPLEYKAKKWPAYTPKQVGDETPATIDQVYGVGDPPVGVNESGESVSGQQ